MFDDEGKRKHNQNQDTMKKAILTTAIVLAVAASVSAAENVQATVHADQAGAKINREIYGQFSEHLGTCIYGGLWVGENSQIPNIQGYRKDVFDALKELNPQSATTRWCPMRKEVANEKDIFDGADSIDRYDEPYRLLS